MNAFAHGGETPSQRNFIECAEIYERAAEYQISILPIAESRLEQDCIGMQRDSFLAEAKRFRELAG